MKFHRILLGALLIAGVALPSAVRGDEQPVEINAILGITGASSFVGQAQQASLQALEATVNADGGIGGRPVRFVFSDNQASPQLTVQLTNAAIAKRAPVLLVSGLLASCKSIEPMVQTNGPVEFCLSQALYPSKDSFVFTAGVATREIIIAQLRYFRARGIRRIASIVSNDATGQDADDQLAAVLAMPEFKDDTLVDHERFATNDLSATAQLERIKNAKAEVVVAWTTGTPFGTILRNIRDVGLDVPIMTNSGNMSITQMKQYASFVPKELYFPGVGFQAGVSANAKGKAAQTQFYAALKKAGLNADFLTGIAWDPARIVIDALRLYGPNATADQVRKYILAQRSYAGISGIYDFGDGLQRGLSAKDVIVFRWDPTRSAFAPVSALGGKPGGGPN